MAPEEFDNQFDVLYNNITSNQAPGLNTYEKSVFLTKAQYEIVKNYFNPKSNPKQEGFDDNPKRQIDFSVLTTSEALSQDLEAIPPIYPFDHPMFDPRDDFDASAHAKAGSSVSITLPSDIMMIINERIVVTRGSGTNPQPALLTVRPIDFTEYDRLMSKPFKRPINYQAWRLINNDESNKADLIVGPSDTIYEYRIRYIRRPKPIIIGSLDSLTIDNYRCPGDYQGLYVSNGVAASTWDPDTYTYYVDYAATIPAQFTEGCELDEMLHEEILQRAVELAKVAWIGDVQSAITAGARSE